MVSFDFKNTIRCKHSANIVELIYPGKDTDLEDVDIVEPQVTGDKAPKHKPIITRVEEGYLVKTGEVEHPMEEDHYIAMIELIAEGQVHKQYLQPGDKPQALFKIPECENPVAKEYCTLHGLWQSE